MALTELDTIIKQRRLCRNLLNHRSLAAAEYCMAYWPEGTGPKGNWEHRFAPKPAEEYLEDAREILSTELAYVVPFLSCPEDPNKPGVGAVDAGKAFFDAAAILKHSICENSEENNDGSSSTFGFRIYALVPPDAVNCMGPNGVEYDRVQLLQSLGYWVKMWGVPSGMEELESQYITDNIENGVGKVDLVKLHALRLEAEFVVLIDVTFHLKEPLDSLFLMMRPTNVNVAYMVDPDTGGVSTSMIIMKAGVEFFDELHQLYVSTPYDAASGWGGTNIGLYSGGMGFVGLLHYYVDQNPSLVDLLGRCLFANNADSTCSTAEDFSNIYGFVMTEPVCGQPWQCNYPKVEWDESTKDMCKEFFHYWTQSREDFQTSHWSKAGADKGEGDYLPDVFSGYCTGPTEENYVQMLDEEASLEICDSLEYVGCEPYDKSSSVLQIAGGAELELNVHYPESCSVHVAAKYGAGADITFSGNGTLRSVPENPTGDTSVVFVVDRSGSACETPALGCSSDENYDLMEDDMLDCQIAAVLDVVGKVRSEGTVEQVGLVSYSSNLAEYQASTVDLNLTDIAIPNGRTMHNLEDSIRTLGCGGSTNYAAAVAKACSVIEQSTSTNNLVVFISDGAPVSGGAVEAYCSNHAIFHTVSVGDLSSCHAPYATSLEKIAKDTSGTCTEVPDAKDLRETLKGLTDLHLNDITGHVFETDAVIDFGCTDIPNWINEFSMDCATISMACQVMGDIPGQLGHTGNSACCACGGGESLPVGSLDLTVDNGLYREYYQTVKMPPGKHDVCTTMVGTSVAIPRANEQCRKIYVCPHPDDNIPG